MSTNTQKPLQSSYGAWYAGYGEFRTNYVSTFNRGKIWDEYLRVSNPFMYNKLPLELRPSACSCRIKKFLEFLEKNWESP